MATAFFGASDVMAAPAITRRGMGADAEPSGKRAEAFAPRELREVYALLGPKIRRFCASTLGIEWADDALQETFARAYRIDPKPPCEEWVPWLYGIARNVVHEMDRSRRKARIHDPLPEMIAPSMSPEDACVSRQRASRLAAALLMLSEERRTILLLRAQEGLSCEEIARALSISVAKVKVDIHRARIELRSRMGEEKP